MKFYRAFDLINIDMNIPIKILSISVILVFLSSGCQPEMPVTSSITVDVEGFSVPVNKDLYGLTIEEIFLHERSDHYEKK